MHTSQQLDVTTAQSKLVSAEKCLYKQPKYIGKALDRGDIADVSRRLDAIRDRFVGLRDIAKAFNESKALERFIGRIDDIKRVGINGTRAEFADAYESLFESMISTHESLMDWIDWVSNPGGNRSGRARLAARRSISWIRA